MKLLNDSPLAETAAAAATGGSCSQCGIGCVEIAALSKRDDDCFVLDGFLERCCNSLIFCTICTLRYAFRAIKWDI